MDNTKVIVVFIMVGGVVIWELFSGKIPSKRYTTRKADSPVAYWIGIALQLAFLAYLVWRLDFDVVRGYSFGTKILLGALASAWSILLVVSFMSQVTRDDSHKNDGSDDTRSSA